jgi:hypothetical protein
VNRRVHLDDRMAEWPPNDAMKLNERSAVRASLALDLIRSQLVSGVTRTERSSMKHVWCVLVAASFLATEACYYRARVRRLDSTFDRPPLCPEAVRIYQHRADVQSEFREVADIDAWAPADVAADSVAERMVRVKKAAALGANGLIVSRVDTAAAKRHWAHRLPPAYWTAVYVSNDSARAAAACRPVSPPPSNAIREFPRKRVDE